MNRIFYLPIISIKNTEFSEDDADCRGSKSLCRPQSQNSLLCGSGTISECEDAGSNLLSQNVPSHNILPEICIHEVTSGLEVIHTYTTMGHEVTSGHQLSSIPPRAGHEVTSGLLLNMPTSGT